MKHLIVFTCVILLFLSGCSYQFEILIGGENPLSPMFTLKKPVMASPIGKEVRLNSFGIYEKEDGKWNYSDPVWNFSLEAGSSKAVSAIEYSKVPQGFREDVNSRNLKVDNPYLAVGIGAGGRGGVEFMIVKVQGVLKIIKISPKK